MQWIIKCNGKSYAIDSAHCGEIGELAITERKRLGHDGYTYVLVSEDIIRRVLQRNTNIRSDLARDKESKEAEKE